MIFADVRTLVWRSVTSGRASHGSRLETVPKLAELAAAFSGEPSLLAALTLAGGSAAARARVWKGGRVGHLRGESPRI